jgi:hypothetical protein
MSVAMVVLFALIRAGEASGRIPPWIRSYGDDLLFLPLILTTALAAHRFSGAGAGWILPVRHGLAAVVFTGTIFEGLLPVLGRGTADPYDILAYLAGWGLFEALLNRPGCGATETYRSSGAHTRPRITPC